MTDDSFRLTAIDVRRYDFGSQFRGYERTRVDQFREQVATELERLNRLNAELEGKARNFHEQLRAFRERDRALNEALISAQQLRTDAREAADREAEIVRAEARLEAERIVREARAGGERELERLRGDTRRLEDEVAGLDRVHRTYIAQLRLLAERQLAELVASEAVALPSAQRRERLGDGGATVDPTAGGAAEERA